MATVDDAIKELARRELERRLAVKEAGLEQESIPTRQSIIEALKAPAEVGGTILSGMVAEPIAGLAGIIGGILPGKEGQAAEFVEKTREALTYKPRTEAGKQALSSFGETVAPIGEALQKVEKGLGDVTYEATGSPALAAAATALPAATMEAIGLGAGRRAARTATRFAKVPEKIPSPTKVRDKAVTKSLLEAAPEINQIKDASRAIYKEIDDMDVKLKPVATKVLVKRILKTAKEGNVDDVLTPKSARVVKQFEEDEGGFKSFGDIDKMRKKAQIAANSLDPSDARLGAMLVDEIDDFMDRINPKAFSGPDAKTVGNVSERYKAARNLWGRARRAELISDAFDKAKLQASGFENGIRTQFRQILNSKKRARYFTKDEISAMRDVVEGTDKSNTLKLIGRLGFSEGAATNVLGGLVGMGVLGPAAPIAGTLSRKFAQKATKAAADNVSALIRGGASGRDIAKAYLQATPKAKRSAQELSDMLLLSGGEIDDLLDSANTISKEAAEITRARRLFHSIEAAGAAAPSAALTMPQQENK